MRLNNVLASHPRNIIPKKKNKKKKTSLFSLECFSFVTALRVLEGSFRNKFNSTTLVIVPRILVIYLFSLLGKVYI